MKTKSILLYALSLLFPMFATAQTPFGDVNHDGVTNTGDVVAIYNYIITGENPNLFLYYNTSDNLTIETVGTDGSPHFQNANGDDVVLKNEFLGEGKGCRLTLSEPVIKIMGLGETNLTKINIPSTVTRIGSGSFYDYPFAGTQLDTIIIPNSVTFIGPEAFERCHQLKYAKIGSGLKDALGHMFAGCESLICVEFDGSNLESINSSMYSNSNSLWPIFGGGTKVKIVRFGTLKKLTYIASNTFDDCSSLTELRMPDMSISFNISSCTALSRSALVTLFKDLATVTTSPAITLGETNLAKLKDDDIKILTSKGWRVPGWGDFEDDFDENKVTANRTGTSQTVTESGTYYGVTWTITNSSKLPIHIVSIAGNTEIACDIAAGASKDIKLYGNTAYIQNYMQKLIFTVDGKQYEKQI